MQAHDILVFCLISYIYILISVCVYLVASMHVYDSFICAFGLNISVPLQTDKIHSALEASRDLSRIIVHVDMDMFYAAVEMRDTCSAARISR